VKSTLDKLVDLIDRMADEDVEPPTEMYFGSEREAFNSGEYHGRTAFANELQKIINEGE
jgi:hypothetical protein